MPAVGVHSSDVLAWLREDRGLEVTNRMLHHAAFVRGIPQPFKLRCGDLAWPVEALPDVESYFRNPRRRGRPRRKAS